MATTEKYTTVIELNSEQAKRQLDELKRKVESWKQLKDEAIEAKESKSFVAQINRELRAAEKDLKKYDNEVARTIDTLNDLGSASIERIEDAQKYLRQMVAEVPHDSGFYQQLNEQLDQVTQELENIKATKAFEKLMQDAAGTSKTFEQIRAEAEFVRQTVENIDTASLKQLKLAEQTAKGIKESAQQGTAEYNGAATSLDKIRAKLTEVENNERKVVSLVERYNQELKNTDKAEQQVVTDTELIDRTLSKLSSASVRDIEYSIKMLNEQLRDTERTGGNVEALTEKLKQLNEELRKVQDMQKPDHKEDNIFSRGITFLNRNWGAITQVIGAYSGLRDVVKGSVDAFAEMDQEMNNVRKYTGQSIEEVERMNEEFKKMDTRTPREQLNQLAGSAGRLGITSTSAVMEFVDAADKINVALGDDLGKGAVDQIGKLAMAFGEDETRGLRGAMLATGSAVNELAQNSAANAGYLVDFTARLSGVGVQAGLTQAQILGLGAAMDENMQKDEMAATALSQIITKMTTDSNTFARIAGKNVEEFSRLVKEDMNTALLQFFESMNKKGGFTELAPLFEQMGLDGQRAIGVLTTLASKIDDVRKHQQLATEAYLEHTSVEAEAAIQNETYQAKLEKARKAFADLRIELGQNLLPVAGAAISTTSMMVRMLSTIITFVMKFKTTIVLLSVTIAALTAIRYKDIIATKLQNFWNVTLMGTLKKLWATMMANPYAAIAVAAAALVGVIADLVRRSNEATAAQKAMASVEHDATVKAELERQKIEQLRQKIHDNNLEVEKRREYIEQLQKIVPDYVAKISEEGRVYEENTEALEKYIQKIKEKAMVDGAKAKMEELAAERAELVAQRMEQAEKNRKIKERQQRGPRGAVPGSVGIWDNQAEEAVSDAAGEALLKAIDDKISQTDEAIRLMGEVAKDAVRTVQEAGEGSGDGNKTNYDTRSYWEQELKDRRAKLKALREDAKATAADIDQAAKDVKEAEDKMELFTGNKATAKEERAEDKARRERERKANDAAKAETEQLLAELTHRYATGRILYCDYVDEQERIQLEGIERRMLIYRTESLEYQKLARKREEMLLNGSEESRKLTAAQLRADHEQRVAMLEEQAWRENMTEQQKNEELFREDMRYMDEQRILYRKGTLERINLERDIEERQQQHRLQQQQYYQQQLEQAREQLLGLSNERIMQLELKNIEEVYDYLIKKGIAKEKEKQEAILAVKAKYASYQTTSERDQKKGSEMLTVARDAARQQLDQRSAVGGGSAAADLPFIGTIVQYQATMAKLKELYGNDQQNHAAYLAAKQQATAQFCESLASQMQAAYNTVNQVMQAASSYFSAQQEYETAQVKKKYEAQIEAAGTNQKKVKKLQEQQQKEEAAIKTKYAKRAAAIQMAQAVAQTAISAINAYSSAAAIPVVGHVLAPIASAMAIAAGMLQIATIKKQQQAQEAGYYEGGFTGGKRYRKEAGVVHEGEFVANHQAVENPAILPFLNFLDQAQRNNTVGSLTAADVSRSLVAGGGSPSPIITPIVNVQTDNADLREAVDAHREATEMLLQRLQQPIRAQVVLTGPDGLNEQQKRLDNLMNSK